MQNYENNFAHGNLSNSVIYFEDKKLVHNFYNYFMFLRKPSCGTLIFKWKQKYGTLNIRYQQKLNFFF